MELYSLFVAAVILTGRWLAAIKVTKYGLVKKTLLRATIEIVA